MPNLIKISEAPSHEPSDLLVTYLKTTAANLADFYHGWQEVKERGKLEGFSEKELQNMIKPYLRDQLEKMGYQARQIDNRIYNFLHKEKLSTDNKQDYENRKSLIHKRIDDNNDIEQSSSPSNILEQVDYLKEENSKLKDTIENMSFGDNPEVFQISKHASSETEFYLSGSNPVEAASILKSNVDPDKKIEFAYRVIQDE